MRAKTKMGAEAVPRRRLREHQGRDRAKAGTQAKAGIGVEAELGQRLKQKQIKGSDQDRS